MSVKLRPGEAKATAEPTASNQETVAEAGNAVADQKETTATPADVNLRSEGAPPMPEMSIGKDQNLPVFTSEPTRVTVKLTPKSVSALERASQVGGLNRTDTVNRAVQLYDFVLDALAGSPDNALIIERNGRQERIILR